MKTKKIITMISSVVMAATLGVSALGGCNKGDSHEHSYKEIDLRPATCVENGLITYKCVCGDIKTEEIVDPDAHVYGEWEITPPSESQKGSAVKTCTLNGSHSKLTVTLPEITKEGTGYSSSPITKAPTSISEGVRHFVYEHSAGDVEFDVSLPKRNVENIEDAILLGTSLHGLIRKSNGRYVAGDPYDSRMDPTSDLYDPDYSVVVNTFSNYYGDNYTRVNDSGNKEDYWYSLDSRNEPFGVYASVETQITNPLGPDEVDENGDALDPDYKPIYGEVYIEPRLATDVSAKDLLGYGYSSGGGMQRTYGAEDTLLSYYQAATGAGAIKYDSYFEKLPSGEYVGWFEYSRLEQPHFCRYRVEFTMYSTCAIKTLSVRTKIIRNWMLANSFDGVNAGEVIYGDDGDIIFSEIYPLVNGSEDYETAKDADGNVYIVTAGFKTAPDGTVLKYQGENVARPLPKGWQEGDSIEYYYEKGDKIYAVNEEGEVYDTGEVYELDHPYIAIRLLEFDAQVLKSEDDEVEENPFPAEELYVRSFDIKYGGKTIAEDEAVTIEANKLVEFQIDNVLPNGEVNLSYDPLEVYLVTPSGEVQLTYDINNPNLNQNSYHIAGHFARDNNRVRIRAQYAGEVNLIIRSLSGSFERPLKLNISKGTPSDLTAEMYTYSDAGGTVTYTWTEYEDTTDNFVTLYVGQTLYVRAAAIAEEENYADTTFKTSVTTNANCVDVEDNVEFGGGIVSKITAVATTPNNGYAYVYVDSVHQMSAGGQTVPVASKRIRIKVVPVPDVEDLFTGEYTGRFSYIKMAETDRTPKPANVTLTFNSEENTMNIVVSGSGTTATCVYSYVYNAEEHTLTCERVSGRSDETFQFEITLNEVYKLSITHPQGYPGRTETIVLSRPAA